MNKIRHFESASSSVKIKVLMLVYMKNTVHNKKEK